MKYLELQSAFESRLGIIDEIGDRKLSSADIIYWLNYGLITFIKDRLPEMIQRNQVFEEDLKTLVTTKTIDFSDSEFQTVNQYEYRIQHKSADHWLVLGEDVFISSTNPNWERDSKGSPIEKIVDVTEATVENVTSKLNNSLSEHRLHMNNARPIRLYTDNEVKLYTDGNYDITKYRLTYLRWPKQITISKLNAFDEYTEMPQHTHSQIVDYAVALFAKHFIGEKESPSRARE